MKLTPYRESIGLNIREAAAQIGVTHESMRRYENGERTPSVEMIALIREWSRGAVTADDFVNLEMLETLRRKRRFLTASHPGEAA